MQAEVIIPSKNDVTMAPPKPTPEDAPASAPKVDAGEPAVTAPAPAAAPRSTDVPRPDESASASAEMLRMLHAASFPSCMMPRMPPTPSMFLEPMHRMYCPPGTGMRMHSCYMEPGFSDGYGHPHAHPLAFSHHDLPFGFMHPGFKPPMAMHAWGHSMAPPPSAAVNLSLNPASFRPDELEQFNARHPLCAKSKAHQSATAAAAAAAAAAAQKAKANANAAADPKRSPRATSHPAEPVPAASPTDEPSALPSTTEPRVAAGTSTGRGSAPPPPGPASSPRRMDQGAPPTSLQLKMVPDSKFLTELASQQQALPRAPAPCAERPLASPGSNTGSQARAPQADAVDRTQRANGSVYSNENYSGAANVPPMAPQPRRQPAPLGPPTAPARKPASSRPPCANGSASTLSSGLPLASAEEADGGVKNKRRERWTPDEHALFLEGLKRHGRRWTKIQSLLPHKTASQIRVHAYSYFSKVMQESAFANGYSYVPPALPQPQAQPQFRSGPTLPAAEEADHAGMSAREREAANPHEDGADLLEVAQIISDLRRSTTDGDCSPRHHLHSLGGQGHRHTHSYSHSPASDLEINPAAHHGSYLPPMDFGQVRSPGSKRRLEDHQGPAGGVYGTKRAHTSFSVRHERQ
jgi:SHAQKYF class myb-like DNA-binding protein